MWCSEGFGGAGFSLWISVRAWRRLLAFQNPQAEACATRCVLALGILLLGVVPVRATTYFVAAGVATRTAGPAARRPGRLWPR
jgi:hypothetical protein